MKLVIPTHPKLLRKEITDQQVNDPKKYHLRKASEIWTKVRELKFVCQRRSSVLQESKLVQLEPRVGVQITDNLNLHFSMRRV